MSFLTTKNNNNYIVFTYREDKDLSLFLVTEEIYDKLMQFAFDKSIDSYFSMKDRAVTKDEYQIVQSYFITFGRKVKINKLSPHPNLFYIGQIPSILKEYAEDDGV